MSMQPIFGPHGPFDADEQRLILQVVQAATGAGRAGHRELLAAVSEQLGRLEELGRLVSSFPALSSAHSLGHRTRDLASLVARLERASAASFDMVLPTRALLGRDLVMAEVNFYRLLRLVCAEATAGPESERLVERIDSQLCRCLYARLAEEVLKHIVSDPGDSNVRRRAALAMVQIWDRNTYRVQDFFPMLQATWDARRRVPATLGTLMGTAEMFGLVLEGCDQAFVEMLTDAELTPDMAGAFREFLFGASTETLQQLEAQLASGDRSAISRSEVAEGALVDACDPGGDPASAMFAFFLTRHLQAAARRLTGAPGPKRTAEEYVMLRYLERAADA